MRRTLALAAIIGAAFVIDTLWPSAQILGIAKTVHDSRHGSNKTVRPATTNQPSGFQTRHRRIAPDSARQYDAVPSNADAFRGPAQLARECDLGARGANAAIRAVAVLHRRWASDRRARENAVRPRSKQVCNRPDLCTSYRVASSAPHFRSGLLRFHDAV
jgi:hypothetical protein